MKGARARLAMMPTPRCGASWPGSACAILSPGSVAQRHVDDRIELLADVERMTGNAMRAPARQLGQRRKVDLRKRLDGVHQLGALGNGELDGAGCLVEADAGSANLGCCCFGHWIPPCKDSGRTRTTAPPIR